MAIDALERFGVAADQGPILVTGPTGGVGSFASILLKDAGYHVVAATGRLVESEYLKANGAAEVIDRAELEGEPRSLAKDRRASVDVIGGKVLANLLASIRYGGAVAACGLAGSMALPTSVAPFILRGISLLGIDSVQWRRKRYGEPHGIASRRPQLQFRSTASSLGATSSKWLTSPQSCWIGSYAVASS